MSGRLIPTGSEEEWLAARRQGVTASEIAVLMGLSPYSSPYALYHQKRGLLPQQDDNVEMELGRYLENFVCRKFIAARPEFHIQGDGRELYAHPERPWQLATPDRYLFEKPPAWADFQGTIGTDFADVCAVLEAKTDASYDGWGDDGSDEIPVHYRCQVLWQLDVLGVTTGFVACLFLHSRKLRVYELTLDDQARADLKLMREEARDFLDRIDLGDPPGVDWRPATRDALKHLHPSLEDRDVAVSTQLAQRYQAACRNLRAAERKKALYENRIREQLGTGRRVIDRGRAGLVIATRQVYDLAAKTIERKPSTVDKLVPSKPREPSA